MRSFSVCDLCQWIRCFRIVPEYGREVDKMRKLLALCLALILAMPLITSALGDRTPEPRSWRYVGAMRVVNCNEYVSLREQPYKKSKALAKVPLGAIVYNCSSIPQKKSFYYCEYEGISGYILVQYLEKAPEYEPPVTSSVTRKMTRDEVDGNGETVLDWKDYNISVMASRDFVRHSGSTTEVLRIGCFIDGEPLWGHEETMETFGDTPMLKAFIGGTEDDPMVMIYNGGYGLTMYDLLSGTEKWTITCGNLNLGNAAATAVDSAGTMYIAGTGCTAPVAISQEGRVIWISGTEDPDLYDPYEIALTSDSIDIKYQSGMQAGYMLASFDYTGELLNITETAE